MDEYIEKKFKDEVAELFDLIEDHSERLKVTHHNPKEAAADRRMNWAFVIVLFVIGVFFAIAKFTLHEFWTLFNNPRAIFQGILLFCYLIAAIYFMVAAYSLKWRLAYIKNPTEDMFDRLKKNSQVDATLFKRLDAYTDESISYVADQIKARIERIGAVKSLFLGAIEKVGLLPGVIATAIAFGTALAGTPMFLIEILSCAMVGIYLGIIPAVFASINLKEYETLFKQYLKLFRSQ